MDDTDRELISLLRDNARTPVVTLAAKLRIARATVQNRISKLEREGWIWATRFASNQQPKAPAYAP